MKQERRAENKQRKAAAGPAASDGGDPDIAGIVPGPQANPWGDEPEPEAETDDQ